MNAAKEMSDCFATNGTDCPGRCGWIEAIDTKAQHLVADQMIKRAKAAIWCTSVPPCLRFITSKSLPAGKDVCFKADKILVG